MPKRIYRVLLLAVVLLAADASGVSARTTIIEPEGSHFPYQRWVDEAKVPTPDLMATVTEEPCPDAPAAEACTALTALGTVTIWINPSTYAAGEGWPPLFFYHELGHDFDFSVMQPWARRRFRQLRHSHRAWNVTEGVSNALGLDEVFADAYAGCAYDHPELSEGGWENYAPRVCNLIENAAKLGGL
jgi:hypothetical protein